ncbi:MAG: glycoside hydrolase [Anaerolineae bacterium]|nr:glycoside hydrolase [Anaerolineae bacterium]
MNYSYPLDEWVSRNPFRGRQPQLAPIPPFSEWRSLLPAPILPDQPGWVEMYWRAWEMACHNCRLPLPDSGFVSRFIDTAFNDHTFLWDSAFMVQFGLYGRHIFPFIGTLDNFYAKQHDDGWICREINTRDGQDFFTRFDPNGTGPNILGWAEWRYIRQTGEEERIPLVFWPLLAYHRWCKAHRTWPNGLYWATGLSSGMDNQPRVPDSLYYHHHWTWIDASLQGALSAYYLEQMATYLGENQLTQELANERVGLLEKINRLLWDDAAAFYKDGDPQGKLSPVKTIGAYWALLDRQLIPEKRLVPFLNHLRQESAFKRPHRIPSISADSEGYNGQTGGYWQGGVWSPTNYMVLKGLRLKGHHGLAHEIALNHVAQVYEQFRQTNTFWENYAPDAAAPGQPAKSHFVGWTGLTPIAILLEDIIGLSVDWPARRVTWDRRYSGPVYGVNNYPLGPEGTLDILSDNHRLTISSDVNFTLIVQDPEGSVQAAITPGLNEIDLS